MAAARPDAPLVTPEAVVVDLPLAGVGTRAAALALDLLIQFAATLVLVLLLGVAVSRTDADVPAWVVVVAFLTLYVAVFWGYPIAMETLTRGRTVGKLALGLRVVTVEGAPVRFRHAFIRAAFGLVDVHLLSGLIGLVTALTTRRTQRLGDLAAGTLVVRERAPAGATHAVAFTVPHGLEGYAATLDVSAIGPREYATVRQFLLRAGQLSAPARQQLAAQIATPLAGRMQHQPPPGISPETFLLCVAARAQQRSGAAGGPPAGRVATPPPAGPTAAQPTSSWAAPPRGVEPPPTAPPAAREPDRGGFAPPT